MYTRTISDQQLASVLIHTSNTDKRCFNAIVLSVLLNQPLEYISRITVGDYKRLVKNEEPPLILKSIAENQEARRILKDTYEHCCKRRPSGRLFGSAIDLSKTYREATLNTLFGKKSPWWPVMQIGSFSNYTHTGQVFITNTFDNDMEVLHSLRQVADNEHTKWYDYESTGPISIIDRIVKALIPA